MAPSTARGQILTELIWALALILGFSMMLMRLYQGALESHQRPRWELKKEKAHDSRA